MNCSLANLTLPIVKVTVTVVKTINVFIHVFHKKTNQFYVWLKHNFQWKICQKRTKTSWKEKLSTKRVNNEPNTMKQLIQKRTNNLHLHFLLIHNRKTFKMNSSAPDFLVIFLLRNDLFLSKSNKLYEQRVWMRESNASNDTRKWRIVCQITRKWALDRFKPQKDTALRAFVGTMLLALLWGVFTTTKTPPGGPFFSIPAHRLRANCYPSPHTERYPPGRGKPPEKAN